MAAKPGIPAFTAYNFPIFFIKKAMTAIFDNITTATSAILAIREK
jgi:hypothetical protein